ncbi:MAG: alanine racemase [Trueperaceae bacterium]
MNRDALRQNDREIRRRTDGHGIEVGYVTKLLCGSETLLREVLALKPAEVMDARTGNLAAVRRLDANVRTVYIKPPAPGNAEDVVRWANVSYNTELATLEALDREAGRQGVRHGVVVMVEMGDLREGIVRERVAEFVGRALRFEHLQLEGIGTNFNCLNGTLPSEDKLWQLSLFRELIEVRHGITVPWISGGTTVALPMLAEGLVPAAVNHFRVGEGLFFGTDIANGGILEGMRDDVLSLEAEVIEVAEKPSEPSGPFGEDPFGGTRKASRGPIGTRRQALVDVGWLDVDPEYLEAADEGVAVVDVSSDIMSIDVGQRATPTRVGDTIRFKLRYMGALKLLNSDYVDKVVIDDEGRRLDAPELATAQEAGTTDGSPEPPGGVAA